MSQTPLVQEVTGWQVDVVLSNEYPPIHVLHFVGSEELQVAHGTLQFWAQTKELVKVYPAKH